MYEKGAGVARITINRPEVFNAVRNKTADEMLQAIDDAGEDQSVGVLVITGAGEKAFCSGGDVKEIKSTRGVGFRISKAIRAVPKPVIAMVNGYAIGYGQILQATCDLSIASAKAVFGQVGPKVGSFDAGFGTAYLARLIGERKAREMWFLCRRYTAEQALDMGLLNKVVPPDELEEEVDTWCAEILKMSPTALRVTKSSFNADSDSITGINALAFDALRIYYESDESKEGRRAFQEKRPANFSRFKNT
jgi:2-ketocyclohexanecarboxyl-CoA hydrolase